MLGVDAQGPKHLGSLGLLSCRDFVNQLTDRQAVVSSRFRIHVLIIEPA